MAAEGPSWQTLLGMGAVIAGVLMAALAVGWLVDTLLNTVPIFIMVGLIVGIAGAGFYIYGRFREYLQS